MDYQVSARKYRPGAFQDVVGQSHVVQTLVNAISTKRIAHAFLFSGTRGIGKTTVARILAKALNCEQGPTGSPCNGCPNCTEITQGTSVDVIEIDGASNTGVDDVREVRENIKFAPFRGRYRVYIIDEVHMLSTSAFNALLKTLEEPPAHVVFIFATTEVHKIPATILSRCQHYNFRRMTRTELMAQLRYVAEQEGITVEDRSLVALARASEGSMRDALSLLDQAISFGGKEIAHTNLEALLGSVPEEHVQALVSAVVGGQSPDAVRVVAHLLDQGHDLRAFCSEVVEYVRNLLVAAVVPSQQEARGLMEVSEDELERIRGTAAAFTPEQLQELFRIFSQAEDGLRVSAHPRFVLEVAAIRATRLLDPSSATVLHSQNASQTKESLGEQRVEPPEVPSGSAAATSATRAQRSVHMPSRPGGQAERRPPVPEKAASEAPKVQQGGVARAATPDPTPPAAAHSTRSWANGDAPAADRDDSQSGPAPGPGSNTPDAIADQVDWQEIQTCVSGQYPNIGPFLDRGRVIKVERGQVILGFSKADTVARAFIEKEDSLRALVDLCAEVTGHPLRIKIVELTAEQEAEVNPPSKREADERSQKMILLDDTRSHPVVKQALEMFGGDVVEVRQASSQKEKGQ